MPNRHAIVIVVDGLRASALGAYGNTWHPTPALDRLASESHVFDWMIADSPELAGFYRAAWLGTGPPSDGVERELLAETIADGAASLPQRLATAGVHAALTTDDIQIAERGEQLGFEEVRGLEFPEPSSAEAVADTELAQLFAIAADQIEHWGADDVGGSDGAPPRRLLWIHARGYHGAWDAPVELRQSLLDEEDPPAPTFVVPPARLETESHDELLLYRAAYAAQTIVLDECVGMLLATLAESGLADSTMVVLVGCRGFALGEHGAVGCEVHELYSEVTHLPLVMRIPAGAPLPPPRSFDLVQPVDLLPTLLSWFEAASIEGSSGRNLLAGDEVETQMREFAFAVGKNGEVAARTAGWLLRLSGAIENSVESAATAELFSKPDDRWEANEIANRCPTELASLLAAVEAFRRDLSVQR